MLFFLICNNFIICNNFSYFFLICNLFKAVWFQSLKALVCWISDLHSHEAEPFWALGRNQKAHNWKHWVALVSLVSVSLVELMVISLEITEWVQGSLFTHISSKHQGRRLAMDDMHMIINICVSRSMLWVWCMVLYQGQKLMRDGGKNGLHIQEKVSKMLMYN